MIFDDSKHSLKRDCAKFIGGSMFLAMLKEFELIMRMPLGKYFYFFGHVVLAYPIDSSIRDLNNKPADEGDHIQYGYCSI